LQRIVLKRSGTVAYPCELNLRIKGDIVVKARSDVR